MAAQAAPGHAPSGRPPAYRFVVGQGATYRLDYSAAGHADFTALVAESGKPSQPPSMLSYQIVSGLTGRMEVTIVESDAAGVVAFYAFPAAAVRLAVNGHQQTEAADALAGQLARGFLVAFAPDGRVVGLAMNPHADPSSRDFVQTLLSALQVVVPETPSAGGATWTVQEEDPSGPYLARYWVEGNGPRPGGVGVRKSMLRYLPAAPAEAEGAMPGQAQMPKVVTPRANLKASLDPAGTGLLALDGTEAQDTAVQGKAVAHSQTTVHLVRTGLGPLAPGAFAGVRAAAQALGAGSPLPPLFVQRSPREAEASIQRTELGDATEADLLAQLAAVDARGPVAGKAAADALYLKFKALVFLQPDQAATLGAILATEEPSGTTFRLLSAVMGAVGSPEAQAALVTGIRARPDDWPAVSGLVPQLCGLPHPTQDAEAAVRGLTAASDPNISAMAWLCLGGMAKGLASADPPRSQAIVGDLAGRLFASGAVEEKIHLIEALGNAAAPGAFGALSPFATGPSAALRAAAMDALRSMPLATVDPILQHALSSDGDATVRLEAAFALGFREPGAASFQVQARALATDKDEKVRAALLENLAKMAGRFPRARTLIREAAEKDPSDYVRKSARSLMQILARRD